MSRQDTPKQTIGGFGHLVHYDKWVQVEDKWFYFDNCGHAHPYPDDSFFDHFEDRGRTVNGTACPDQT